MKIFELHFNPKENPDRVFTTFCQNPEKIYEKKIGSLFLAGELRETLPQNFRLLEKISRIIKEKYYSFSVKSPEESLKQTLKSANNFLEQEVFKDNVSWLGNLNFAIVSICRQKKFRKSFINVNFTKTGDIKIILLKQGVIEDIGKNLELQEIEPYPLKIFRSIAAGELFLGDKILILTKDIFSIFDSQENGEKKKEPKESILKKLSKETLLTEKSLKEIISQKQKELSNACGICLLIDFVALPEKSGLTGFFQKENSSGQKIYFQKELEKFSIRQAFSPILIFFAKIRKKIKSTNNSNSAKTKLKRTKNNAPSKKKVKILKTAENKLKLFNKENLSQKNLILVLALFFLVLSGFIIFQKQEKTDAQKQAIALNEIIEKVSRAEKLIPFNKKEANILLQEALEEITTNTVMREEANSLKEKVERELRELNRAEEITEPKIVFEFNPKEFIPQSLIASQKGVYLFSSQAKNIFKIEDGGKGNFIQTEQGFSDADIFNNFILFFSKPNKIYFLKNDQVASFFSLKLPYPDSNFDRFSAFAGNLYFLDSERSEIIKYQEDPQESRNQPQLWITLDKNQEKIHSFAIDKNIWMLNEKNEILQYYLGKYQKKFVLEFFPKPKRIYKIFASSDLPYFYLLEPIQNRIVILNKNGDIIKQFRSEKFDNLKDFSLSQDRKTIYILNGLMVYQITF